MNSPGPSSGEWNLLEKALPNVSRGTCEGLLRYADLVLAWNSKINLTGAKSRQEFIQEHILDCLAAKQAIFDETPCIDVGTGAGLPGVVWAIGSPSTPIVLLDSSLKRTAFIQRVRAELNLENTHILAKRFEGLRGSDLPPSIRSWDLVSRGTAAPGDLLQLARRSPIPWRRWYVFSNEKTHAEYLTQAPPLGVEVEKIFYSRFSSRDEAGRPGILTLLQKKK
jgi:16S rRNA (guanine527-N7)-methyltransferase